MDPSQDPIFNMSLNAQIIAALLGGNFVALVSDFGPLSVPPTEPLSEPSSDPSTEPPTSPLAQRRRFQEDPPEDEPPAKYARYHENEKPIDYSVIELNTCLIMRFTEEDGKTLLLNEDLLPNRFVRNIISKIPLSVKDRMNYLARFRQNDAEYYADTEDDAFDIEGKKSLLYNLRDKVYTAYIKEWRLRAVFRKVVHRLRINKIDKRTTEEIDPITLSVPEKPVTVYDWSVKKKFVFDAKSLATFIESKLLYNEGGFALPIFPSNPWTNIEFTYAQLVSIYYQLSAYGQLRWGLSTMYKYDFNKTLWHRYHHSALTMSAIKTSLIRLDSADARELLLDFILSKVDELQFRSSNRLDSVYRTAVQKMPTHWYIEECKAIAMIHYEAEHFGYNRLQTINQRCLKLFKKQKDFIKDCGGGPGGPPHPSGGILPPHPPL
jgi:hypothetical protein